nr:RNA-directed DNA polymerase, eukaryota, reverse transcriptase zinc-binding domain protein [Tanacetum cinerariifolium]
MEILKEYKGHEVDISIISCSWFSTKVFKIEGYQVWIHEQKAYNTIVSGGVDHIDARALWKICEPYGRIVDSFIARKTSKLGKRFGFVRFTGIANDDMFVRSMSNIWIGNYHVFVAVAKFQRSMGSNEGVKMPTRKGEPNQGPRISNVRKSNDANMHQSYVSIVNGGVPPKNSGTSSGVKKWAFKTIETMKRLFGSITPIQKNFVIDERKNRIDIQGLPLCAWGSAACKRVVMMLDVSVMINGETFEVHVRELSNWSVKIVDDIESEDGRSEDENLDTQAESYISVDHVIDTPNDSPDELEKNESPIIDNEDLKTKELRPKKLLKQQMKNINKA